MHADGGDEGGDCNVDKVEYRHHAAQGDNDDNGDDGDDDDNGDDSDHRDAAGEM